MNENELTDVKGLQDLCGVKSPQAMIQWVKDNLDKINADGIHAEKAGKSWLFDQIAVERILKLRRVGTPVQVVATDNARIRELEADREALRDNLLKAQLLVAQKQEAINKVFSDYLADTKLLAEAKDDKHLAELALAKAEAEIKVLEAKREALEAKNTELLATNAELKQALTSLQAQLQALQNELQQEKGKGLLAKLFNR